MMTPKAVLESDRVMADVTVTDIRNGDQPAILTAETAVNFRSGARPITQKLPIRDAALFARLLREVRIGDTITAEIVTEWYDDDYATYLANYSVTEVNSTAPTIPALAIVS